MKDYMAEWKRNSIRIGAPTCIMAAFTAFIPVLYLCSRYGCWPKLETVLAAWALTALSFGAFYIVEPISYYAALGMSGTYLGFLSGNIGNMRVPCAALALDVTDSKSGTIQAEVVSTMAICGSIITKPNRNHRRCFSWFCSRSCSSCIFKLCIKKLCSSCNFRRNFWKLRSKIPESSRIWPADPNCIEAVCTGTCMAGDRMCRIWHSWNGTSVLCK